ncbi:MAG: outer membrane lipoprotein-sorting protein [Bdellovibrionaceae bacterium]|nr:outer membrane lipoprotein-sorting protein [Pseudobdellovibrionaceae bacterium]
MTFKKILFVTHILFLQAKAQADIELRAKVLNALRTKTEIAEVKISQIGLPISNPSSSSASSPVDAQYSSEGNSQSNSLMDSKPVAFLRYSFTDLNPATLQIQETESGKAVDLGELLKLGINADVLSYSFFNSVNPKPFGINKTYHITYTAVKTDNNSLSHFLVYYDKKNFYPVKVAYYNGSKKVTTIEYLDYKKLKDKVWRAHVITAENHLNQKRIRVEFTKIEINPDPSKLRIGKGVSANPV